MKKLLLLAFILSPSLSWAVDVNLRRIVDTRNPSPFNYNFTEIEDAFSSITSTSGGSGDIEGVTAGSGLSGGGSSGTVTVLLNTASTNTYTANQTIPRILGVTQIQWSDGTIQVSSPSAGGGSGGGIVSPGTFTWTNTFGISLSTVAVSSAATFSGNVVFSSTVVLGSDAGTSGQLLKSNGPGTVPSWYNDEIWVLKTATQTITGNSFADITELSFSALENTTYYFEAHIIFQTTTTTTGANFSANGPASPKFFVLQKMTPISLIATTMGMNRAYNTGTTSASVDVINSSMYAIMFGILANGANAGTFIIRGAAEVAAQNLVISPGSFIKYRKF